MATRLIVQKEFTANGVSYQIGEEIPESEYNGAWPAVSLTNRLKNGFAQWEAPEVAAFAAPTEDELAARRAKLEAKGAVKHDDKDEDDAQEKRRKVLLATPFEEIQDLALKEGVEYTTKPAAVELLLAKEFAV